MQWDLFCNVIDNHGDIGVCWRLAADLAGRGEQVRLWTDDASPLEWLAPQGHAGVQVLHWKPGSTEGVEPPDAVVEAFGCTLDDTYLEAMARKASTGFAPVWVNLEYLSAEAYVERNHGLSSPVLAGPASGLHKRFFFPGFTRRTGGLLREPGLLPAIETFDRGAWLARAVAQASADEKIICLFCYEPLALDSLLAMLAAGDAPVRLLRTAGRANHAAQEASLRLDRKHPGWNARGLLRQTSLPLLAQTDFDRMLWSCDFNFVRGEDSLVRALWAGKPFAWQIYPQHDGVHAGKLEAFLSQLQAPAGLREFHLAWNGLARAGALPRIEWEPWAQWCLAARDHLVADEDLTGRLLRFVREG